MTMNKLEEWGEFAPKNLKKSNGKCPTRRVGKRLIESGEIPGKIIDGQPWVYVERFHLQQHDQKTTRPADIESAALALLIS